MRTRWKWDGDVPVIVPWTTDPFFSSIVTVSLFNFIKKLFVAHTIVSVCWHYHHQRMDPVNFRPLREKQSFNNVARWKAYRTSFIFTDWCRERFFWVVMYSPILRHFQICKFWLINHVSNATMWQWGQRRNVVSNIHTPVVCTSTLGNGTIVSLTTHRPQ